MSDEEADDDEGENEDADEASSCASPIVDPQLEHRYAFDGDPRDDGEGLVGLYRFDEPCHVISATQQIMVLSCEDEIGKIAIEVQVELRTSLPISLPTHLDRVKFGYDWDKRDQGFTLWDADDGLLIGIHDIPYAPTNIGEECQELVDERGCAVQRVAYFFDIGGEPRALLAGDVVEHEGIRTYVDRAELVRNTVNGNCSPTEQGIFVRWVEVPS